MMVSTLVGGGDGVRGGDGASLRRYSRSRPADPRTVTSRRLQRGVTSPFFV